MSTGLIWRRTWSHGGLLWRRCEVLGSVRDEKWFYYLKDSREIMVKAANKCTILSSIQWVLKIRILGAFAQQSQSRHVRPSVPMEQRHSHQDFRRNFIFEIFTKKCGHIPSLFNTLHAVLCTYIIIPRRDWSLQLKQSIFSVRSGKSKETIDLNIRMDNGQL
jgi:hypothetical protein